jgi:hypothetical protein
MAQPQRGVRGDAAPAVDDLGDAVHRHLDLSCQLGRGHAELLSEVLTGVNRGARHCVDPQ